jgi:hypothetical protein
VQSIALVLEKREVRSYLCSGLTVYTAKSVVSSKKFSHTNFGCKHRGSIVTHPRDCVYAVSGFPVKPLEIFYILMPTGAAVGPLQHGWASCIHVIAKALPFRGRIKVGSLPAGFIAKREIVIAGIVLSHHVNDMKPTVQSHCPSGTNHPIPHRIRYRMPVFILQGSHSVRPAIVMDAIARPVLAHGVVMGNEHTSLTVSTSGLRKCAVGVTSAIVRGTIAMSALVRKSMWAKVGVGRRIRHYKLHFHRIVIVPKCGQNTQHGIPLHHLTPYSCCDRIVSAVQRLHRDVSKCEYVAKQRPLADQGSPMTRTCRVSHVRDLVQVGVKRLIHEQ